MSSNILKIKDAIKRDENITGQQYHTYTPYTTSFNYNDEIRIAIQSQDLYVLPSESYLSIEFTTAVRPGIQIVEGQNPQLTYNFMSHLFSEMRYELNSCEIDRCKKPGITSLLRCMIATKLSDKHIYEVYSVNSLTNVQIKTYRAIVPLRFIFGFCDDNSKIVLNCKHELILVRSGTDLNAFQAPTDCVAFTINKIHWKVQHISLSDQAKLTMLKTLNRNESIPIAFRSYDLYELPVLPQTTRHNWTVKTTTQITKPRYIVVAFQTNRNQVVTRDAALFDNCNVSDIKVYLNNDRYPYDSLNLNFNEGHYQELYHMLVKIQQSYYSGTSAFNPLDVTFENFANRPIFAFDCSRSDESVKNGMVDVRIEMEARANFPDNTSAFCLIIHDNLVRYSPFSSIVHRDV